MHVGRNNENNLNTMNNQVLPAVTEEKDLGVIFTKDMKPSKQCTAARNKANRVLGLINRTLMYKNKTKVNKPVYSTSPPTPRLRSASMGPFP